MRSILPPHRADRAPWAIQWIEGAHAALAEAGPRERPTIATALAAVLFACGQDDAAEAVLSTARREAVRADDQAGLTLIEIALADGSVTRDYDARAHGHLAAVGRRPQPLPGGAAARAWLVEAKLARAAGRPSIVFSEADRSRWLGPLEDASERRELELALALEQATSARLLADWNMAHRELERALELSPASSSPRMVALVEIEVGLYTSAVDDPMVAYARIREAIEILGSAGLRRDEGRAMIRLAEMMSSRHVEAEDDSAPLWLGRAKAALGATATWRDRSQIRAGLRAHGRRLVDRAMNEETASRIEGFEWARGALLSAIFVSVEAAECALNDLEGSVAKTPSAEPLQEHIDRERSAALSMASSISPAIGDVDRVVNDLIDLIGAALVERDRLRSLLNALSDVDAEVEKDALPALVARVAARILDADHVVVALPKDGELDAAGRWGEPGADAEDSWKEAARTALGEGAEGPTASPFARRSEAQPTGPVLVVKMRANDATGVIYADKIARNGQFREQDRALAFLLAEYSAIALGRLHAREQEQMALSRLAVTLDAIRDGVLSWDPQGVIFSTNAALDRMLRVGPDALVGAKIRDVPALAPLWAAVAATPRLDGAVVRMPSGNFVVSTRPLGTGDDASAGIVATLVELDRAQKIAQRIGAGRPRYSFQDVVGSSPALLRALAMARQAATIDSTVLITGESGTGKEIIAQAIHTAGARGTEPFIGLNVAALPRELLEAELFGYERGAFTGARGDGNLGKFELAGGGTILLDEIGEMPLDMQAKLLRVLQERVVVRLGGSTERPVNARVMATTHRDLGQLVEEGKFRMDLLYRLRVLSIELPALRERAEDIPVLAQHYLSRFAEQQRKRVVELSSEVQDELCRYDWPGNIRELANVMESEVSLLPPDTKILTALATRLVGRFRGTAALSTGEFRAAESVPFSLSAPVIPLAELEKRAFLHALEKNKQNVARAAEALGVSKVTFYAKLKSWGMHPKNRFDDEPPSSAFRQSVAMPVADPYAPTPGGSVSNIPVKK